MQKCRDTYVRDGGKIIPVVFEEINGLRGKRGR